MRLPRLTTWRLMAIVAAVGIVLGLGGEAARLAKVSRYHRRCAGWCARTEARFASQASKAETELAAGERRLTAIRSARFVADLESRERASLDDMARAEEQLLEKSRDQAARWRAASRYYSTLEAEHRRISWRPWLPVPPGLREPR
jgi:hypothetical protein